MEQNFGGRVLRAGCLERWTVSEVITVCHSRSVFALTTKTVLVRGQGTFPTKLRQLKLRFLFQPLSLLSFFLVYISACKKKTFNYMDVTRHFHKENGTTLPRAKALYCFRLFYCLNCLLEVVPSRANLRPRSQSCFAQLQHSSERCRNN